MALRPQWRGWVAQAVEAIPRGGLLPEPNWRRRHLALSLILLWHFPLLLGYGLAQGFPVRHSLADASLPLLFGAVALRSKGWNRSARSIVVATGLITCSISLVHLSHGLIEMHFHFFVMVALLSLYQDWKPFLVAIGMTVVEHGVTGVVEPHAVYNHADAWAHPWKWAFIHGGFVVAASVASITAWSMSEADHRRMKHETTRLHQQREAMLSHAAHHDQLTGLPNRRMVADHLEAAAARSRAGATMLGVVFVDLDRFKEVNDTYGHMTGDAVLRATAERLKAAVRGMDMAARLGGDEFVIVYEGLHNPAALEAAAHRIEQALSAPIELDGGLTLCVEASLGHVLATGDDPWQDLIERADLDMYRVKHLRRRDMDAPARPNPSVPRPRD
jgi:diguanylate cyclase (GGDEF)-like protein